MNRIHRNCFWLVYLLITHTLSLTSPAPPEYTRDYYEYGPSQFPPIPRPLQSQQTSNFENFDNYYVENYTFPSYGNETTTTTEYNVTTVAPTPAPVPQETTTLAPFTLADVKVPIPFLRIEYMISFTFLGIMYGLGFFVLFQSLCVPAAKLAVTIVYLILLKAKKVDPVTLEQALEQLPPT